MPKDIDREFEEKFLRLYRSLDDEGRELAGVIIETTVALQDDRVAARAFHRWLHMTGFAQPQADLIRAIRSGAWRDDVGLALMRAIGRRH